MTLFDDFHNFQIMNILTKFISFSSSNPKSYFCFSDMNDKSFIQINIKIQATCFFNAAAPEEYQHATKTVQFPNLGAMSQPCGYNKDTGIFTVEIEGLYLLTFHVHIYNGNHCYIGLRVDGKVVCERYSSQSGYEAVSCSTIQQLRIGQTVDVYLTHGKIFYARLKEDNTFHGVLLK